MKRKGHPMTFLQVRRKSYRLRSHKRHPRRCPQHLLLDSLHIHHSKVDMSLHKFRLCALYSSQHYNLSKKVHCNAFVSNGNAHEVLDPFQCIWQKQFKGINKYIGSFHLFNAWHFISSSIQKSLTDTFLGRNKKNSFCLLQNTVILSQFCLRHDISKLF